MTQTEALKLALEALEVANSLVDGYYLPKEKAWLPEIEEAITAIKAALEAKDEPVVWNEGVPAMLPKQKEGETFIVSYEPKLEAKDEPVAWQYRDANDDGTWSAWTGCDKRLTESDWRKVRPLYTTPPQQEAKDEPDQYAMDIECTKCGAKQSGVLTVHTTPPQRTWVGLTDEEFKDAINDKLTPECIAIAIEAKLKEKNT